MEDRQGAWSTVKDVLTSGNGIPITIAAVTLVLIILLFGLRLGRRGLLGIRTKHVRIGSDLTEREIIRRQVETAHSFVMSIEGKVHTETARFGGYFTKYILERVYDEVIKWVMFNHITNNSLYVEDKQACVCNLVYSLNVGDDFKTPDFKQRMCAWTKELIERLVSVRDIYGDGEASWK